MKINYKNVRCKLLYFFDMKMYAVLATVWRCSPAMIVKKCWKDVRENCLLSSLLVCCRHNQNCESLKRYKPNERYEVVRFPLHTPIIPLMQIRRVDSSPSSAQRSVSIKDTNEYYWIIFPIFPPNFEGLVLGCIDADFCKKNMRWKALAEIYTMHSFAPFSNLNFFVKNRQKLLRLN